MPLINPFEEFVVIEASIEPIVINQANCNRIINYLNCPNWKCPSCGSTVFGRTLICPFNQNGIYCKTRRPE